jgi:hypothetical protein
MAEATLKLEKAAAKSGGDRYGGELGGEQVSLYIPQSISRQHDGEAAGYLSINVWDPRRD